LAAMPAMSAEPTAHTSLKTYADIAFVALRGLTPADEKAQTSQLLVGDQPRSVAAGRERAIWGNAAAEMRERLAAAAAILPSRPPARDRCVGHI
jgi:hypothetical protein